MRVRKAEFHPLHENDERNGQDHHDGQVMIDIVEGHHVGLPDELLIDKASPALRGKALFKPLKAQGLCRLLGPQSIGEIEGCHVLGEAELVELSPPRQHGGHESDAEAVTQVPHKVEDRRGVPHFFFPYCRKTQYREGDDDQGYADAHQGPGPHDREKIGEEIELRHDVRRDGHRQYTRGNQDLLVPYCHQASDDGHAEEGGNAAGRNDHAGKGRCVSHQGLDIDGRQDKTAEEVNENEEQDEISQAERVILERSQVEHGMLRVKLHKDEENQGNHRNDAHPEDEFRREPVIFLPPVQNHLEVADSGGKECQPPVVDLHHWQLIRNSFLMVGV